MRGKVQQLPDCFRFLGITPAYAGKSIVDNFGKQCPEDHPRLCGEKAYTVSASPDNMGSPPPMRGKD